MKDQKDQLFKMPYSDSIINVMFEAKTEELKKVSEKYGTSFPLLKSEIQKELKHANFKIGTCNTAIDFFILSTLKDNKIYPTIKKGMEKSIEYSAIHWLNVMGKSEYV